MQNLKEVHITNTPCIVVGEGAEAGRVKKRTDQVFRVEHFQTKPLTTVKGRPNEQY